MGVLLIFVGIVVFKLLILLLNFVDCRHCYQLGRSRFPTDKFLRVLFLIGYEIVYLQTKNLKNLSLIFFNL